MQLLFLFDQDMSWYETLIQALACQRSWLMQLLFSFDQDTRVDDSNFYLHH